MAAAVLTGAFSPCWRPRFSGDRRGSVPSALLALLAKRYAAWTRGLICARRALACPSPTCWA